MTKHLLTAVLVLGAVYGLVEAWPLLQGPVLAVHSPLEGAVVPEGVLTVQGVALRISELSLNGAPLYHEENGDFSAVLTFPRGGSILTFVAADRFGRRIVETRTIYVP